MKRRIAALVLCLLFLFQLPPVPAKAAERVYFTAVGSYVLPLSDNTMPFWSGGYVYVPSSIFTGASTALSSGSTLLATEHAMAAPMGRPPIKLPRRFTMPGPRRVVAATSDVPSAEYITTLVELLPTSIVRFRSILSGKITK